MNKKQKAAIQRKNNREFWTYYPDGRIAHHTVGKKGKRKVVFSFSLPVDNSV